MSNIETTEQYIDFQGEKIFTKMWKPVDVKPLLPIVLFHDSLGCIDIWRDFPQRLAQITQRTVIAYDRWGFGKSSARTAQVALNFIALEAQQGFNAIIEASDLQRYILLGHSVGGGMAVCAAEQNPQQCEAIVSIAAQAFIEKRTTDGVRAAKEMFKDPVQLERLAKYHGDKAKWVLEAWTETWLSESYQTWTLEPNLKNVICPLLAIHGEFDEYGVIEQPQYMVDMVQQKQASHCKIIMGAGHVPHREKPEEVLAEIQEFLMTKA